MTASIVGLVAIIGAVVFFMVQPATNGGDEAEARLLTGTTATAGVSGA